MAHPASSRRKALGWSTIHPSSGTRPLRHCDVYASAGGGIGEGVATTTVELRRSSWVRNDWHARSAARTLPTRRRPLNASSRVHPRRTSIRHCDESSSRKRRRRVSDHRSGLAADGPSDDLSPSPLHTASRSALGAICAQTLQRVLARPNGRWLRRQDSQICPVERLSPRTARSYVLPISHIMSSKARCIALRLNSSRLSRKTEECHHRAVVSLSPFTREKRPRSVPRIPATSSPEAVGRGTADSTQPQPELLAAALARLDRSIAPLGQRGRSRHAATAELPCHQAGAGSEMRH